MGTIAYQVPGHSRARLGHFASAIRRGLGYSAPWFPIDRFLERDLPTFHEDFSLEIEDVRIMGDRHGVTYPSERRMVLRCDVYEGACRGYGRDRFTLAHELGHYLLHDLPGLERSAPVLRKSLKPFQDSEWQANTFAAELLMPVELLQNYSSIGEITFEFGVSRDAARVQVGVHQRQGALSKSIRDD